MGDANQASVPVPPRRTTSTNRLLALLHQQKAKVRARKAQRANSLEKDKQQAAPRNQRDPAQRFSLPAQIRSRFSISRHSGGGLRPAQPRPVALFRSPSGGLPTRQPDAATSVRPSDPKAHAAERSDGGGESGRLAGLAMEVGATEQDDQEIPEGNEEEARQSQPEQEPLPQPQPEPEPEVEQEPEPEPEAEQEPEPEPQPQPEPQQQQPQPQDEPRGEEGVQKAVLPPSSPVHAPEHSPRRNSIGLDLNQMAFLKEEEEEDKQNAGSGGSARGISPGANEGLSPAQEGASARGHDLSAPHGILSRKVSGRLITQRLANQGSSMRASIRGVALPWRHTQKKLGAKLLLSVCVTTFNMGDAAPREEELAHWLPTKDVDLVVIGLQESSFNADKERRRLRKSGFEESMGSVQGEEAPQKRSSISAIFKRYFGSEIVQVTKVRLMDMRLLVFAHRSVKPHITDVRQFTKATGIGGVIGNKGGLILKMTVMGCTLCFVSCHLAAHESEKRVRLRNADMFDILKLASKSTPNNLDSWLECDHTFVFGDLNYRINLRGDDEEGEDEDEDEEQPEVNAEGRRDSANSKKQGWWAQRSSAEKKRESLGKDQQHKQEVVMSVLRMDFPTLYRADQLQREMGRSNVLCGFQEMPPSFPPTFKVLRYKPLQYNLQRVPSYCDRILHASHPSKRGALHQTKFDFVSEVKSSDHKPVVARFTVSVGGGNINPDNRKSLARVLPSRASFAKLEARTHVRLVLTSLRATRLPVTSGVCNPVVRFYGPALLREKLRTEVLKNVFTPEWESLPVLTLKSSSQALLQGQCVYITIWNKVRTNWTLLGQAMLDLTPWSDVSCQGKPLPFDALVQLHGMGGGRVQGDMLVVRST